MARLCGDDRRRPAITAANAAPLSTAFTYQGQFLSGGVPVSDVCDSRFRLFDDPLAAAQVGPLVQINNVTVTDGLFAAELDFGAVFDGTALWLEIEAHCPGGAGAFTPLSPRQELTVSPHAAFALLASSAGNAVTLGGPGSGASLRSNASDSYTNGTLTFNAGTTLSVAGDREASFLRDREDPTFFSWIRATRASRPLWPAAST